LGFIKSNLLSLSLVKKSKFYSSIILVVLISLAGITSFSYFQAADDIISFTCNPKKQNIDLYWKNDKNEIIGSLGNLNSYLSQKGKTLVFAMNGGMYMEDQKPLGLFIQNKKEITKINTRKGGGNFYLKPNGIFYITDKNEAKISVTGSFKNANVKYATQSGPMLVINDTIHKEFTKGSKNLNIRNGVGILADGQVLFAMSKTPINFYDFALFFKNKGCKNALYLDGFVSRIYYPEKNWVQKDGNFGVIIGVTNK